jgi:BMFP domain-containing protein YqiC
MADETNWPTSADLARQLQATMGRFESLGNKLEAQFINKDMFALHMDAIRRELEILHKANEQMLLAEKERNDRLATRIDQLEGNFTWIVRIIIAAVVVAVLAGIGISKAGGGG